MKVQTFYNARAMLINDLCGVVKDSLIVAMNDNQFIYQVKFEVYHDKHLELDEQYDSGKDEKDFITPTKKPKRTIQISQGARTIDRGENETNLTNTLLSPKINCSRLSSSKFQGSALASSRLDGSTEPISSARIASALTSNRLRTTRNSAQPISQHNLMRRGSRAPEFNLKIKTNL